VVVADLGLCLIALQGQLGFFVAFELSPEKGFEIPIEVLEGLAGGVFERGGGSGRQRGDNQADRLCLSHRIAPKVMGVPNTMIVWILRAVKAGKDARRLLFGDLGIVMEGTIPRHTMRETDCT
jgi:hypothetical protein